MGKTGRLTKGYRKPGAKVNNENYQKKKKGENSVPRLAVESRGKGPSLGVTHQLGRFFLTIFHRFLVSASKVLVSQSCPTLWYPKDCSPPCSSVHGICQARILEWFTITFSREPSQPRDQTQVSCIAGRFFTV